jgi:hypothetical protein
VSASAQQPPAREFRSALVCSSPMWSETRRYDAVLSLATIELALRQVPRVTQVVRDDDQRNVEAIVGPSIRSFGERMRAVCSASDEHTDIGCAARTRFQYFAWGAERADVDAFFRALEQVTGSTGSEIGEIHHATWPMERAISFRSRPTADPTQRT